MRIIAERAYLNLFLRGEFIYLGRIVLGERSHVDMGDAGISTLGLAFRPAHHFHTGKIGGSRKIEHFCERQSGQNRANKAKLHEAMLSRPTIAPAPQK